MLLQQIESTTVDRKTWLQGYMVHNQWKSSGWSSPNLHKNIQKVFDNMDNTRILFL